MLSAEIVDLINRKVDGMLSDEENTQIESALDRNPEAHKYHDEMMEMSDTLTQLGEQEPPREMMANILNAISPEQYAKQPKTSFIADTVAGLRSLFAQRPAYSFAVGLAFGLFVAFIASDIYNVPGLNNHDLTGTLTWSSEATRKVILKHDSVNGTVEAGVQQGGGLLIHFDLHAARKLSVSVSFDQPVKLLTAIDESSGFSGLTFSTNQAGAEIEGDVSFKLVFAMAGTTPSSIWLVFADDEPFLEEKISLAESN